ncbi:hypothetical protein DOY81_012005 [Sarcophaga bullata]|nr:hypothetical protein DOY81_012005 [Sarcophaga bullata]
MATTADLPSSNERHYYAKLEAIKDIRDKTVALEKLKVRIIKEVKLSDDEDKCLDEYRKELEHLLEEKMSHVEELRQIHADINDMENIIKQTKENQTRSVDMANRHYEEYLALKYQIDHMRRDYLGLSPLRDLHEEEGTTNPSSAVRLGKGDFSAPPPPPPPSSRLQQAPSIGLGHHPTFRSDFNVNLRQQPPPMKSCLSCHQQIHRNAPICPLCKAKSRSRNPKKPKKKNN